jgi:DinB family protein
MQIENTGLFLEYFDKVHQRTLRVARSIPPDKMEWSYRTGKFTLGDLVRHIATIERYMFVETIQGSPAVTRVVAESWPMVSRMSSRFFNGCISNR